MTGVIFTDYVKATKINMGRKANLTKYETIVVFWTRHPVYLFKTLKDMNPSMSSHNGQELNGENPMLK